MALTLAGVDNPRPDSLLTKSHLKAEQASDELRDKILDEINRDSQALKPLKDKFLDYERQFQGKRNGQNYDGLADLFVPETLKAVETIVSIIVSGIFDNPKFFRYSGREETDEASAQNMTELVYYQMDEIMFELGVSSFVRQMCIYGTAIRKVLWDFEERNVKVRGENGPESKNETIRDTWTFENVDPITFVCPPDTPWYDIQKAKYCAEDRMVDIGFLQDKARKKWISNTQLQKAMENYLVNSGNQDYLDQQRERMQMSGISLNLDIFKEAKYRYIERYGLVEAKYVKDEGDKFEDDDLIPAVAILVNGVVVKLEKLENVFWHNSYPYVSSPFIPLEGRFWSLGVCQVVESLQDELNDTRNQTMDNKTLILACMWLADPTSGIKTDTLRVEPNKVLRVKNKDGIAPLPVPLLAGQGVNIEGVIKEDIRQAVAAVSGLQGTPQQGVGSATEFQGLQSAALSRSKTIIKSVGECALKPLFKLVAFLNNQFYDHKKLIRVIGENGIKQRFMSPEEIKGLPDVVLELSTDFDKNPNLIMQQKLNFLGIITKMPPEMINQHWGLLKEQADCIGFKSFDQTYPAPITADNEILLDPEEELQVIMNNQPATVKPGHDHIAHLQAHSAQHQQYALAMTPLQADLLGAHIRDHMQYIQEMQKRAMQAQQIAQTQMMAQAQKGVKKQGGQNPNSSPDTIQTPNSADAMVRSMQ